MAKKIITNIKDQIFKQTRDSINTEIELANVIGVSNQEGNVSLPGAKSINPGWTRGNYNLERVLGIEVDDFLNYSGKITWEVLDGKIISIPGMTTKSNNLFGIQLLSEESIPLYFSFYSENAYVKVFTKIETATEFTEHYSFEITTSRVINIPLSGHVWNTIIFTFYALNSDAKIRFASNYDKILSWRHLDITSPSVPDWHSIPLTNKIIQDPLTTSKVTLKWNKDTNIGFSGNGIYRKSSIDSGYTVDSKIPASFINSLPDLSVNDKEENRWFSYFGTVGSLNSGDIISFGSSTSKYTISKIIKARANKVLNPIFSNSTAHWTLTGFTEKNDAYSQFSANYINLDTIATNSNYKAVSSLFSVSTSIDGYFGLYTENNYLAKRPYGLGGYGGSPSRWTSTGSIDSLIATRQGRTPYIRVVRSGPGQVSIKDSPIYFSTAASYNLFCSASFLGYDEYKVNVNLYTGATIYSSPSIPVGNRGFYNQDISITPSASGTGYIRIIVAGTNPTSNFATMFFKEFRLQDRYYDDVHEWFQLEYYKADKNPSATPFATLSIDRLPSMVNHNVAIGSRVPDPFKFPLDCAFMKIAYVASINVTSTSIGFYRNIYGGFALTENINPEFSIFSTQACFVRTTATVSFTVGSVINFEKFEHIFDRPRQADDGAVVTWDDFDIEDATLYSYYLDAFDTSAFKNRSAFSTVASITSGDTVAPKRPTNYVLTPANGGIFHTWTNPTAPDLKYIKSYSNIGLTNVIFRLEGPPGASMSYSEITTSTALASRFLTAIDAYGNQSASTVATVTPLPGQTPELNFSINFITAGGSRLAPNEDGWFKHSTVVSSFMVDMDSAIASYLYSFFTPTSSEAYGAWVNAATGTTPFNESTNYKYYTRYKIKDIYGNYSDIIQHQIFMDTQPPSFTSNRKTFWNHTLSGGYNGYNLLSWNDTFDNQSKYQSPVLKAVIERAEITSIISNPGFEDNISVAPNGTLRNSNWALQGVAATLIINSDDFSEGDHCLKYLVSPSGGEGTIINVPNASINRNSVYYASCKYKAEPIITISTIAIALEGVSGASQQVETVIPSTHWEELSWVYTHSSATIDTRLVFCVRSDTSGDAVLFDEVVLAENPIFSTIAELDSKTTNYIDTDIKPWVRYLYRIRPLDAARNVGTISHYKYMRAKPDYRDRFRNILDNSSFERTHFSAGGTLRADSWVNWTWNGQFATLNHGSPVVGKGDSFHGHNYVKVSSLDRVYQNDINVLPYIGQTKRFVVSFRSKPKSGTGGHSSALGISAKDKERTQIATKTFLKSHSTGDDWELTTGTFTYSSPSIVYLDVVLTSSVSGTTSYFDAVQLEEKASLPPTDYYDGVVVRADHIQGNLIRANMIEAEAIYADHIKANTITATQVNANTITTNELNFTSVNVYLKDNEPGPVQIFNNGVGTFSNCNFSTGTNFNNAVADVGYFVGGRAQVAGSISTFIGWVSNSFDGNSLENISYIGDSPTLNVNHLATGYCYPIRPHPHGALATGLLLLTNINGTMYSSYATLGSNPYLASLEYFSTPLSIADGYVPESVVVKQYGNHYYTASFKHTTLAVGDVETARCEILKLNTQGSALASRHFAVWTGLSSDPILAYDMSFDISASGTILFIYSKGKTPLNAVHCVGMSTMLSISIATFDIQTYGVLDKKTYDSIGGGVGVCDVAVSYITGNHFILGYNVGFIKDYSGPWHSSGYIEYPGNMYYYKVIDSVGSIIIGDTRDLSLMTTKINRAAATKSSKNYRYEFRGLTSHDKSGLFYYTSPTMVKDDNGFSTEGKYCYLRKTSATINLIDLINRIA